MPQDDNAPVAPFIPNKKGGQKVARLLILAVKNFML
jgi:hypothetical protein